MPFSRQLPAALVGLGVLAASGEALAVPPTAADFEIRYFATDENGERARQMTQQDLQQFHNRARCECNQLIEARITLMASSSGQAYDPVRVRAFAGTNCAAGQLGNTSQNRPCVLLDDKLPAFWNNRPSFKFPSIWLSSGVTGTAQSLDDAVPESSCDIGAGEGGIWICVENGMQTDCQQDEFIISGTQSVNGSQSVDPTTGQSTGSGAITFDYDPPLSLPTDFKILEGDGAVVLSWSQPTQDPNFRVLCADADGNPVKGKGISPPSVSAENQGQLYWTEHNLCPDGPFDDTEEGQVDNPGSPSPTPTPTDDGGTGDGGTGGTSFGTGGTFGAEPGEDAYEFWYGDHQGGLPPGTTSTGGTTTDGGDTGGTTGGDSGTTSGGASGSGGSSGSGSTGNDDAFGEGILSLDWAYVCSGHLAPNSQRARVEGLENGKEYQFILVAYDNAGNPIVASDCEDSGACGPDDAILVATPRETTDLWEQCEMQGNVCGSGGFCNCTSGGEDRGALALGLLALLGLVRRRRR